jgi:putative FmdB family regulatory protein
VPLYQYEHENGSAGDCSDRFEVLQSVNDPPLPKCPKCGRPCRRVFSRFSAGRATKGTLSPQNLEKHGFTQYTRAGGGYYEKTAGKGPRVIKG